MVRTFHLNGSTLLTVLNWTHVNTEYRAEHVGCVRNLSRESPVDHKGVRTLSLRQFTYPQVDSVLVLHPWAYLMQWLTPYVYMLGTSDANDSTLSTVPNWTLIYCSNAKPRQGKDTRTGPPINNVPNIPSNGSIFGN